MKWLEGDITRIKLDDSNRDRRDKSEEWYFQLEKWSIDVLGNKTKIHKETRLKFI